MPPILETPLSDTATSFKIALDAPLKSGTGGMIASIQPSPPSPPSED